MNRLNENFIDILFRLHSTLKGHGEPFRSRAYEKAEETLINYRGNITSTEDIKGLPNIGPGIIKKLEEFVKTGEVKYLSNLEKSPINVLTSVHGIGSVKAKKLIQKGITTLNKLKKVQETELNSQQKTGLLYYDDIQKRIPKDEIDLYDLLLRKKFDLINDDNKGKFLICGSYRRGHKDSGDIDVAITHEDGDKTIYKNFVNILKENNIIVDFLTHGETKSHLITRLPGNINRRMDFLYHPPTEYAFAVLHFTGSKQFNVAMRQRARNMGYTLNEQGIFYLDDKNKKGNRVTDVKFTTEKDIFKFLDMKYKEPEERVDASAIQTLSAQDIAQRYVKENEQPVNINDELEKLLNKRLTLNLFRRSKKTQMFDKNGNLTYVDSKHMKSKGKKTTRTISKILNDFRKDNFNYLDKIPRQSLVKLLKEANETYWNNHPILTNKEYDVLTTYLKEKHTIKLKSSNQLNKHYLKKLGKTEQLLLEKLRKNNFKNIQEMNKDNLIKLFNDSITLYYDGKTILEVDEYKLISVYLKHQYKFDLDTVVEFKEEEKNKKKRIKEEKELSKAEAKEEKKAPPKAEAKEEKELSKAETKEEKKAQPKAEPKAEPKEKPKEKKKTVKKRKEPNEKKEPKNKTVKNKTQMKVIEEFREKGITIIEKLTEKKINKLLIESSKSYYNQHPFMTDNEYDIIREYAKKKYPKIEGANMIGVSVEKNKVKLPYFMGSMDKIKPDTGALDKWKKKYKGAFVISGKLDGVSGLYSTENNEQKLYTRGDGVHGHDISHLVEHLKLPTEENMVIRGEFIIKEKTFQEKYKGKFSNSRNFVSGIINSKKINTEYVKDLDFVAYELINPELTPEKQFEYLNKLNVDVVKNITVSNITNKDLSDMLVSWRTTYTYQIDGIIVVNNEIYPRKEKNPEHAFAFKMILGDQIAEAKVIDLLWSPSKDGLLKPKIRIEPVHLGGVKIEYATAFNGGFVEKNNLGVGALVKLIRSGDVIPHIMEVVEPAEKIKWPEVDYEWTDKHVDIKLKNKDENDIVRSKNIAGFFIILGVKQLGQGNVDRIIKAGYNDICSIIAMSKDDLLKVDGFQEKLATNVYNNIHKGLEKAPLTTLMAASNIFGAGFAEKRFELIISNLPNILTDKSSNEDKIRKIKEVKGMSSKTASKFIENIDNFNAFLEKCKLKHKRIVKDEEKEPIQLDHELYAKNIVLTGFRDSQLETRLKKLGVNISTSISKNTFLVVVKSLDEKTGKVEKAKEKNIQIMELDKFKERYLN